MSEQDKQIPEHDPAISAIYRKTADIEPPTALDAAVLASAERAAAKRKHRWMVPLSTAAIVVLSMTLLLDINDSGELSHEPMDDVPVPKPEVSVAEKPEPAILAESAAPATPPEYEAQAKRAAPSERVMAQAPKAKDGAKSEAKTLSGLTEDAASFADTQSSDSAEQKIITRDTAAASVAAQTQPVEETASLAGMALEQLGPRPWLEKIRKLVDADDKDAAIKELESFKKAYPDYDLPDDLKSLRPTGKGETSEP